MIYWTWEVREMDILQLIQDFGLYYWIGGSVIFWKIEFKEDQIGDLNF